MVLIMAVPVLQKHLNLHLIDPLHGLLFLNPSFPRLELILIHHIRGMTALKVGLPTFILPWFGVNTAVVDRMRLPMLLLTSGVRGTDLRVRPLSRRENRMTRGCHPSPEIP